VLLPGQQVKLPRAPKARKFYIISYSLAHKLAGFEVENLDVLRGGAWRYTPQKVSKDSQTIRKSRVL